jgi:hypothetical protein
MEKYQKPPYNATLREAGIEEDQEIVEDRLSEKWGKVGINYGFWQLTEVERIRRQPSS